LKQNGGLMTVPAAPALVTITEDKDYYNALLESDIVIPDSGYMILIWRFISGQKLNKISGLEFIDYFISRSDDIKMTRLLLVNPSKEDGEINKKYLINRGFLDENIINYSAPFYKNDVKDYSLLELCDTIQPKWIMINIGGGTQEKLGLFLKTNLSLKPAIICTGAAISFKTGRQVKMPLWIDKIYLGWLSRCISNPKLFIPRYIKGFKLFKLLLKYRNEKIN
jgi:UDP-N-acetyl-D-mannosaminuronic acid transferase (WecB/TagA/CpsF family)